MTHYTDTELDALAILATESPMRHAVPVGAAKLISELPALCDELKACRAALRLLVDGDGQPDECQRAMALGRLALAGEVKA